MAGQFVWHKLLTSDAGASQRFYSELLGWEIGEQGPMIGVVDGGQPWAELAHAPELDGDGGKWIPYVQVDDVDAAAARAEELGARVVRERTSGPAGSYIGIADPTGARIALWQPV